MQQKQTENLQQEVKRLIEENKQLKDEFADFKRLNAKRQPLKFKWILI